MTKLIASTKLESELIPMTIRAMLPKIVLECNSDFTGVVCTRRVEIDGASDETGAYAIWMFDESRLSDPSPITGKVSLVRDAHDNLDLWMEWESYSNIGIDFGPHAIAVPGSNAWASLVNAER